MLTGHYAPALLLRRAFPGAPLWTLFLAAQAVDVGFFSLSLLGIESARVDPAALPRITVTSGVWTHSLLLTPAHGLLALVLGRALSSWRLGAALALGVVSHWGLDLLVHAPDLPLGLTQEPAVGLGLWTHPPWATLLELALVAGSWAVLRPALPARARRRGDELALGLLGLQLLADLVVPPPTSAVRVAISAQLLYAGLAAAAWRVDRAAAREEADPSGSNSS